MKGKITQSELEDLQNLYDIANSPSRMTATLQTPATLIQVYNDKMKALGTKYHFDTLKTRFNLNTGEFEDDNP